MHAQWRSGWVAAAAAAVAGLAGTTLAGPASPAVGAPVTPLGPTPTPTDSTTPSPTSTPTPTPTPAATDNLLRPDVVALPATNLSVQVTGDGRRLRFQSALGNLGPGVLEIRPNRNRPCPASQHNSTQIIFRDRNDDQRFTPSRDTRFSRRTAGCMVYHRSHDHWHFKASARYSLLERGRGDRTVVSARRKVSFCLRDSDRLPRGYGRWTYPVTYGACQKWTPQGIAVGWMDIYQSFLAGQSLPLPRSLPNGTYCLETVVDPLNQLVEANDDNNTSLRALAVRGTRVVPRPTRLCR